MKCKKNLKNSSARELFITKSIAFKVQLEAKVPSVNNLFNQSSFLPNIRSTNTTITVKLCL